MARHNGWKYIGHGTQYVAYLVGDEVVKVPTRYFRNSHDRFPFNTADFEIPPIGNPDRLYMISEGMRQAELSQHYGDFGVRTSVDREGLLHQEHVEGIRPTKADVEDLKKVLGERGMSHRDIHTGNFRKTELGYRMFDYGQEYIPPKKKER